MSWTRVKEKDNTFCTFASDIEGYQRKTEKNPRCPLCRKPLTLYELKTSKVVRDREGDPMEFYIDHDCGAHLRIFND